MTAPAARLVVHPERCDRCGHCVRACPHGLLRVGGGYIYVDVSACQGCFSCVEVCDRSAISRAPTRPVALKAADAARVVVGSRAEAKALRRAATSGSHSVSPREREKTAMGDRPAGGGATGAASGATATNARSATGAASRGFSLFDAATVAFAVLVAIALKDAVLQSPALAALPTGARTLARVAVLVIFYSAQLGILYLLARRKASSPTETFRIKTGSWPDGLLTSVGLVVALVALTRVASLIWGIVSSSVGWMPPAGESSSFQSVFGTGGGGLALALLFAVILGPLVEELAFRGVIASALASRFGKRAAVLGSAGLFAFYHLTPWQFVPMFVFGCALGWLAIERRTLWPAIALHAAYNGVVVAVAFWLAR